MTDLSICIISRNEEQNIQKCLRALAPMQCEIIVTDTGSSDNTLKIAAKYTRQIYQFPWCDDFSAARNFTASRAASDWILAVDCDEYMIEADLLMLHTLISEHPLEIGMINRISPYPRNNTQQTLHEYVARLYNRNLFAYKGKIHETVEPLPVSGVPTSGNGPKYFEIPLTFFHAGYQTEDIRRQKAERDLKMLQETLRLEGPSSYTYYQLGKCYVVMNDPALAAHYFDLGLNMDVNPALTYVQEMVESYGYCLLDLRQYAKALQFENLYGTFAVRADFVFLMGLIYMNNARFPEAIAQFEKATKMSAYSIEGVNSYSAWYNIGVIYECLGKHDLAMQYYGKCGSYQPAVERIAAISCCAIYSCCKSLPAAQISLIISADTDCRIHLYLPVHIFVQGPHLHPPAMLPPEPAAILETDFRDKQHIPA